MNPLAIIFASPLVLKVFWTLGFVAAIAIAMTFFLIATENCNDFCHRYNGD